MAKKESNKTVMQKTTVPANAVAFIYQCEYFFYLLTKIKKGEEIGFEVKEDIHIDYADFKVMNKTKLIQIKHTILKNQDGEFKNLTDKDEALWHTISNWIDTINDKDDGRKSSKDQLDFINSTEFELVTNMQTSQNIFFKKIEEFKKSKNLKNFKNFLNTFITKQNKNQPQQLDLFGNKNTVENKDNISEVDRYIQKLLQQNDKWIESFLKKISVQTVQNLKDKIIENLSTNYHILRKKINRLYEGYSEEIKEKIKREGYSNINKASEIKITISYEEYRKGIEKCYNSFQSDYQVEILEKDKQIPDDIFTNPENQTFIKQLLGVKYFDDEDDTLEEMRELSAYRFGAENSFKRYEQEEIDTTKLNAFKKDNLRVWKLIKKQIYNPTTIQSFNDLEDNELESKYEELGLNCLLEVLKQPTPKLLNTFFDGNESSGHFYWLSDIPEIGWRYDWEKLYKNKKNEQTN